MKTFITLLALGTAASAFATPIIPTSDSFGPLPAATFGGTGIPNEDVAISYVYDGPNTITLGLTAHQRYSNPALANDAAGTFAATAGANFGDPLIPGGPGPSPFLGSTWNFAWYINVSGMPNAGPYTVSLLMDTNPGVGTAEADHLSQSGIVPVGATVQNSSNLLFIPGFNPYIDGEYTFALIAKSGDIELGRSAITVNVTGGVQNVPETGSAMMLLSLGMTSLVGFRSLRRRN